MDHFSYRTFKLEPSGNILVLSSANRISRDDIGESGSVIIRRGNASVCVQTALLGCSRGTVVS